jgi:hypothetical protein
MPWTFFVPEFKLIINKIRIRLRSKLSICAEGSKSQGVGSLEACLPSTRYLERSGRRRRGSEEQRQQVAKHGAGVARSLRRHSSEEGNQRQLRVEESDGGGTLSHGVELKRKNWVTGSELRCPSSLTTPAPRIATCRIRPSAPRRLLLDLARYRVKASLGLLNFNSLAPAAFCANG